MAYIGKNLVGVLKENRTVVTSTGDGSTSLELNETPGSVNNVLVFLDGIRQQPTTDYTVSGSMLTFTTGPETGVKIVAIVGNHSGVEPKKGSVTTRKIVDGAVTGQKLADGNIPTSKFSGALPAIDGSNLLGVHSDTMHKSPNDPAINTNTIDGQAVTLGQIWVNTTSGEMYICTDVTENAQHWINVGAGEGDYTNVPPTNPTNATSGYTWSKNGSHQITFTGGTDVEDGTASHYVVDNITGDGGNLTVSTAEMSAGQAHTFVVGDIGASDITGVTFRVRSKDSDGAYSTGVTITVTLGATAYTVATGGNTIDTTGDYRYHIFTAGGTFNVTTVGDDASVHYLVLGGGGSGGAYGGTGAGAGGFKSNYGSVSGRNSSVLGGMNLSQTSYSITVGNGAAGITWGGNWQNNSLTGNVGGSSSFNGITATGGGGGGGSWGGWTKDGATGGGGSEYVGAGSGVSNEGFGGGSYSTGGDDSYNCGGGGGGTGQAGANASYPNAGNGGNGIQSNITGSNTYYGGGGGGSTGATATSAGGSHGTGGLGGGTDGITTDNNNSVVIRSGHGGNNTGGGSGGAKTAKSTADGGGRSGNGGSGVVIIRYKFRN